MGDVRVRSRTPIIRDGSSRRWKQAPGPQKAQRLGELLAADNFVRALRFVEENPDACCYMVPLAAPKGGGMFALHSVAHRKVPRGLRDHILWLTPVRAINHPGGLSYATPLHMAVSNNKVDLVAWLLQNTADPNSITSSGKTPLDKCLTAPGSRVEKLLRQAGGKRSEELANTCSTCPWQSSRNSPCR